MKKQIQLAGTYYTLKYIKNQFNLLKKNKQETYSYNQGFEPRREKKKDLKRNQTFNNKMCANHTLKSIYIETVEINFIQEVNIPRSDS